MGPRAVFITGASRGLGLEFVKQILSQPSPPQFLIAACREPSRADELQALAKGNGNLKIIKMDVTKDEDIASAFEQTTKILGNRGLNLLINNAAIHSKVDTGFLETQTRERMQSHFDTNVTAPVLIVKKFLPLLKMEAKTNASLPIGYSRAAIVNISSILGSIQTTLETYHKGYHYHATKAALNMMTAMLSMDLRDSGILVAAIHPGWVKTDMGGQDADLEKDTSIEGCWSTISSMTEKSAGQLLNYDGEVIPW